MALTLLTAQANGDGASIKLVSPEFGHIAKRHSYTVYVSSADFDSATAIIEASPDEVTWFPVPSASWSANATANIEIYGIYLRGSVSGGMGSELIDMVLV